MKPFTVVGYYEDNGQPYVEHVEANDWVEAMRTCILDHPEPPQASELVIVSVFDGAHKDQTEHESCVYACDVPGVAQCDECDKFIPESDALHAGEGMYCSKCLPD